MLHFAVANLFSRPGRTVLAVLGLTTAIAGMVGLFSIAGGIESLMSSTFGPIPGLLIMQPGAPIPLFSALPAEWSDEIEHIDGVHVVTPEIWIRTNTIDGQTVLAPPRFLGGMDLPSRLRLNKTVFASALVEGRFFRLEDQGSNRCVISRQLAEEFSKNVGDDLQINSFTLSVIGIYETGSLLLDAAVLADIQFVREIGRIDSRTISSMYVEPEEGVTNKLLEARIADRFRGRASPDSRGQERFWSSALTWLSPTLSWWPAMGQLVRQAMWPDSTATQSQPATRVTADTPSRPDANLPLDIRPAAEMSQRFDELTADLDIVLALLTGLGVLIAVFSILNTMLMSVTERTVEFGILRANGWSSLDVVKLVTSESALLGISGGVLGLLLGWIGTQVVNTLWADRLHLYASPQLLVTSLLFSILVGTAAGGYPALRAARMSPMEAIRRG